jgi:hypothetical protein
VYGQTQTTYSFTASGFSILQGSNAASPYASLSGTYTLSFDPGTGKATLSSINFSIGSTQFNTSNTLFDPQNGCLSGYLAGVCGIHQSWTDFLLTSGYNANYSQTTGSAAFRYSDASVGTVWEASNVSITQVVPEPAAWLMMIFGFGMVGTALRRAQKAAPIPALAAA